MEWRRGGKAGNCCCGAFPLLPNHYHHIFSHTNHRREPHFFRRTPTAEQERSGRAPRAEFEKILNSRELFVDFLCMDCCTPRASPGSGPTWFGQIPGQTNAGPFQNDLTRFIDDQVEALVSWVGAAKCKTSTGIVPCAHGRTCFDAARASSG